MHFATKIRKKRRSGMKEKILVRCSLVLAMLLTLTGFQCNQQPGAAKITSAIPSKITVRTPGVKLTVLGSGFTSNAQLVWGGQVRQTAVISPSQLSATILATDLTQTGPVLVAVAQNATVSNTLTITIAPAQLALTANCPSGQVGVVYTCTLQASGGVAPYTFSSTGTLPPGLTLSSAGVLSGTPTQFGTFNATITVTDSAGSVPARLKVRENMGHS